VDSFIVAMVTFRGDDIIQAVGKDGEIKKRLTQESEKRRERNSCQFHLLFLKFLLTCLPLLP
jgi:hypothetical protein